MNKQELATKVKLFCAKHNLSPQKIAVGFGSAMVMYGLRSTTSDIDMDIRPADYQQLKRTYPDLEEKQGLLGPYVDITEDISVHPGMGVFMHRGVMIDGIRCYSPQDTLEMYQKFAKDPRRNPAKREQDQATLQALEKYIAELA